jgi:divalent metal cation (Fe/Co/Zn/Cd) transporter
VHRLAGGETSDPTRGSVAVAVVAVLVLPALARAKYRAAARVESAALRTDAHITSVGAVTALLSLVGVAGAALGSASVDGVAALLVAVAAGATGAWELRGWKGGTD